VAFGFGLGETDAVLEELGDGLADVEADFLGLGLTEGFTEAFGEDVTRGLAVALGALVALVDGVGFAERVTRGLPTGLAVGLGLAETVGFGVGVALATDGLIDEIGISKPKARAALVNLRSIDGYFQLGKALASRPFHFSQGKPLIHWHFAGVGVVIWTKLEKPRKHGKVKLWQLWALALMSWIWLALSKSLTVRLV